MKYYVRVVGPKKTWRVYEFESQAKAEKFAAETNTNVLDADELFDLCPDYFSGVLDYYEDEKSSYCDALMLTAEINACWFVRNEYFLVPLRLHCRPHQHSRKLTKKMGRVKELLIEIEEDLRRQLKREPTQEEIDISYKCVVECLEASAERLEAEIAADRNKVGA